jgi:hypothetical protein
LAGLILLDGCDLFKHENIPQLPPITMEGKNTFGCLVNGKVWLPGGRNSTPSADFSSVKCLNFNATTDDSGFLFSIRNAPIITTTFDLTDTSKVWAIYDRKVNGTFCTYESYHVRSGTLVITKFDKVSSILSGTFQFKTFNFACGDTVKIAEGRFDIGDITW